MTEYELQQEINMLKARIESLERAQSISINTGLATDLAAVHAQTKFQEHEAGQAGTEHIHPQDHMAHTHGADGSVNP